MNGSRVQLRWLFFAGALLIAWMGASLWYVAARSPFVHAAAKVVAAKTQRVVPSRDSNEALNYPTNGWEWSPRAYSTSGSETVGDAVRKTIAQSWRFPSPGDPQLLIVPFHAVICLGAVLLLSRRGFPAVPLSASKQRVVLWRTFWGSSWRGALWILAAQFVMAYWYFAWDPTLELHAGRIREAFISIDPAALDLTVLGAFVGYLGSVCREARRRVWLAVDGAPAPTPSWIQSCIRCGYPVVPGAACPECGIAKPDSVGLVYYHESHAKVARRTRFDPLRLIHAIVVVLLMAWPLIAGVASKLS